MVLAAVAWSPLLDPRAGGEQELARLSGTIHDGLQEEWDRLLQDLAWMDPWCGDSYTCPLEDYVAVQGPRPEWQDWTELQAPGETTFDLLFSESENAEIREQDLDRALALVQEALAKTQDPKRRARAHLRLIQLAGKNKNGQQVAATWRAMQNSLTGSETLERVSLLLRGFLAAAPHLPEVERKADYDTILTGIREERIALDFEARPRWGFPGVPPPGWPFELADWMVRLSGVVGPESPSMPSELARSYLREIRSFFPERPEGWPAITNDGQTIFFAAERVDPSGDDLVVIRILSTEDLVENRNQAWLEQGLLPSGFLVAEGEGQALRRIEFDQSMPPLRLVHTDPEAWLRAAGRGRLWMRLGLTALAITCVAAGVALQRTLARERRLHQLRTDFVANVSHELRTPLASILLMAENLEVGRVSDEAGTARYHRLIRREAMRLRRLVDDVLDFSRIDRGEAPHAHLEAVSLDAWREQMVEEAVDWVQRQGGNLMCRGHWPESEAMIDGEALRRAVLNLLDNALRHSGSERCELNFEVDGLENQLVIEVRDHGCGIPAGRAQSLFQPFVQAGSAAGSGRGAGLGLAIVAEIARAHGGSVSVANAAPGGALFRILIPYPPAMENA